jgi:hypothetical protein
VFKWFGLCSPRHSYDPSVSGSDATVDIAKYSNMNLVSLATGAEDAHYTYAAYVAKDKETGKRVCFVFDCGDDVDEVLSTLSQAFAIASDDAKKPKKKTNTPKAAKAKAVAAKIEKCLYLDESHEAGISHSEAAFAIPDDVGELMAEAAASAEKSAKPTVAPEVCVTCHFLLCCSFRAQAECWCLC